MSEMMNIMEIIQSRRSIRSYADRPIEEELLQEILKAGMYAPSAENSQPWYFVVIQSEEKMNALRNLMEQVSAGVLQRLKDQFPNHPEVVDETTRFIRAMGGAPVCVLAFWLKPDYDNVADNITQSIAAAIENMLLAARARGIGSCWLTAPSTAGMGEELQKMFAPDHGKLTAMITFGYPKRVGNAPRRKEGRYVIV